MTRPPRAPEARDGSEASEAVPLTTGCKLDRSNGLKMDTLVSG
jgi:hypothetical protein